MKDVTSTRLITKDELLKLGKDHPLHKYLSPNENYNEKDKDAIRKLAKSLALDVSFDDNGEPEFELLFHDKTTGKLVKKSEIVPVTGTPRYFNNDDVKKYAKPKAESIIEMFSF